MIYALALVSFLCFRIGSSRLLGQSEEAGDAPPLVDQSHRKLGCRPDPLPSLGVDVSPEKVVSFIGMGDIPYSLEERYCLNSQLRDLDLSSPDGPAFVIHVGDIRQGDKNDPCFSETYNDIAEIFSNQSNALNYDHRNIFMIVGDNEWSDCDDEDYAFDLWREHFGHDNSYQFGTFSSGDVLVERQTDVERRPGLNRGENFAFYLNSTLFIGLNMIGGSARGDEQIRLAQNFDWTRSKLEYYALNHGVKALVVFGHAPLKDVRERYFGADFYKLLRDDYPDLPAMYLRGDGHDFCIRYPDPNNSNLIDVMVDRGGEAPPILISIVRDPENDAHTFEIDRRGGLYSESDVGECPFIEDHTWTTPVSDPDRPDLVHFGNPDDAPKRFPLSECEGDCDHDDQCKPGLACFQREAYEDVPGCSGIGLKGKDYCFDADRAERLMTPLPTSETVVSPTVSPTTENTIAADLALPRLEFHGDPDDNPDKFPLGPCAGDCDRDKQCLPGLRCKSRRRFEAVPGCQSGGSGDVKGKDYCYNPLWEADAINSPSLSTLSPTVAPTSSTSPPSTPISGHEPTPSPTSPPTTNPTSPPTTKQTVDPATKTLPPLKYFGNPEDDPDSFPLEECAGDCDRSSECQEGLLCFKRDAYETVPGCESGGAGDVKGKDYCFSPPSLSLEIVGSDGEPSEAFPLGECEGDCDRHSDCRGKLRCFKRKRYEEVPGCFGIGRKGKDYCYQPEEVS